MTCHNPQSCNSRTCGSNISDGPVRGSASSNSLRDDDVDKFNLQKFWGNLSCAVRRDLLRIDKQSLFEQVRKNMYCSRCNGLLLEVFSQLVDYSKGGRGDSLWHHNKRIRGSMKGSCNTGDAKTTSDTEDDIRDSLVHRWGGLTVTRDNTLTFIDCLLEEKSMEVIQNACDCARARERERQLLYPDSCGGGGRGWMGTRSGRGHNLKETCALHTARLSCDVLVDFWSALGEDTRRSLLRMKEEDFVARLNFRFDSKRFCRDCRRNVLRELKELKDLKRCRKELKCTSWFCNADTAFSYEVSDTCVQANWGEFLGGDMESIYEHFEWGLGSTEGDCDILGFEDVGLSEGARVDGLDLEEFSFFYITLRAWKRDGKCSEVSVKAHRLKDRECVHRRLFIGDGYLTITEGEGIRRFFEQAEEAEEEEDDEGTEKNGTEGENDSGRARRHAKSPELARDFLLDAATIIFKEQVEKAFREGTARQNAHTMFVSLAVNLLEERIHVACKEISTLAKQKQLLEEEELEKQEEEKKRERKKIREKEKKNRKKAKQRGQDHDHVVDDKDNIHSHDIFTCNSCDSRATSIVDDNEEACSDDEMRTSSLEETIESSCSSGDLNLVNFSTPTYNSMDSESQEYSNDGFILEHSKRAKRRSKMRKGSLAEKTPRRVITRGGLASLDSSSSSDLTTYLKSTRISSVREITDDVLVGTQKHNRKVIIGAEPSAMKWSSMESSYDMQQKTCRNPSERRLYVKNEHSNLTWFREDNVQRENLDRKSTIISNTKDICCVSESLQCNWPKLNSSRSEEEKHQHQQQQPHQMQKLKMETTISECNGSLSTGLGVSLDLLWPSCRERCCEGSCGTCEKDQVVEDSSEPASSKTSRSSNMPLKLVPISLEGSLDEDAGLSSRPYLLTNITSDGKVTSTSDGVTNTSSGDTNSSHGGLASYSVASVSSLCLDCTATSVGANTTKISNSEEKSEGLIQHRKEEELTPLLFNADHHTAFNRSPCHYPYSSDSNLLLPYVCGYENNTVLDHGCERDSPNRSYNVIPHSSFGSSQVQSPCLEAHFPHPRSLCCEGESPEIGGQTSRVQARPLPFHSVPWGFTRMPVNASNYTWWGGQEYNFDEHYEDPGLLPFGDGFQQYENVPLPSSSEPLGDSLGFSLFHFGNATNQSSSGGVMKPLDIPSCSRYVQREAAAMSKSNLYVEEYSLFAATPSNRFSFF